MPQKAPRIVIVTDSQYKASYRLIITMVKDAAYCQKPTCMTPNEIQSKVEREVISSVEREDGLEMAIGEMEEVAQRAEYSVDLYQGHTFDCSDQETVIRMSELEDAEIQAQQQYDDGLTPLI
jgi:hypothetical protein